MKVNIIIIELVNYCRSIVKYLQFILEPVDASREIVNRMNTFVKLQWFMYFVSGVFLNPVTLVAFVSSAGTYGITVCPNLTCVLMPQCNGARHWSLVIYVFKVHVMGWIVNYSIEKKNSVNLQHLIP